MDDFEGKDGWRPLGDRAGCEARAADLIADYRRANALSLVEGFPDKLRSLFWHEGQLRAAAGDYPGAVEAFRRARATDDPAGVAYADATLAFVERDRGALLAARDRLKALPRPDWFTGAAERFKAESGQELHWPPALDIVEGFLVCFDKPYGTAYSDCRVPARKP